jgi:hypothetical protein
MSTLARHLCIGIIPKIGQEACKPNGFKSWLEQGSYAPSRENLENDIILERISIQEISPFLSFDYERFALACLETHSIYNAERVNKNVVSWPLLKCYYASFFAAHSVMRSKGLGVTRITSQQAQRLTNVIKIYNPAAKGAAGGDYIFKVSQNEEGEKNIKCHLSPAPSGKGVHDIFWSAFSKFLTDEAQDSIEGAMPEAGEFFTEVTQLVDAIKNGGGSKGSWLSSVRNQINYEHLYDTWHPISKRSECLLALGEAPTLASACLSNSKTKTPITAFLHTTLYLTGIGIEIGDVIADRSTKGKAFGQKWRRLKALLL